MTEIDSEKSETRFYIEMEEELPVVRKNSEKSQIENEKDNERKIEKDDSLSSLKSRHLKS